MPTMRFRLRDETGKAPVATGMVDANPDGVYVLFDRDIVMASPRVAVQLYDGKLEVLVFGKGDRDEPTHQVVLDLPMSPKDWSPRR